MKKLKIFLFNKKNRRLFCISQEKYLSKKQLKLFGKIFSFAIGCLLASASLDIVLWFSIGYKVPSFTIGIMSLGFAFLMFILLKQIEKEYNSRGSYPDEEN